MKDFQNPRFLENAKLLSISYYNCGAEQEYLSKFDEAVTSFRKSYQISTDYLGRNNPLSLNAH